MTKAHNKKGFSELYVKWGVKVVKHILKGFNNSDNTTGIKTLRV